MSDNRQVRDATCAALREGGLDVLYDPRRFVAYVADNVDAQSTEMRILRANCDNALLRLLADGAAAGTPESLQSAQNGVALLLSESYGIRDDVARDLAQELTLGVADYLGVSLAAAPTAGAYPTAGAAAAHNDQANIGPDADLPRGQMPAPQPAAQPAYAAPPKKNVLPVVLGAVCAALAVVLAVVLLMPKSATETTQTSVNATEPTSQTTDTNTGESEQTATPEASETQHEEKTQAVQSESGSGNMVRFAFAEVSSPDLNMSSIDQIIASGPVADSSTIASSAWASAVRDSGVLRVGGARASMLFAYDDGGGRVSGFDAALYQLLARYITGNQNAFSLTRISTDTREQVLQNGSVDAVFATYTITPERSQLVSFAGPYFQTRQGLMVRADETSIQGLEDLAGKTVGVEAGSIATDLVPQYAPGANLQILDNDNALMQALSTEYIDAYVMDTTILMGDMVQKPGQFRLLGEFGTVESYGIGLPYNSDGVAFINDFLRQIEADGTWARLWQVCFGNRVGIAEAPQPPTVG